MQDTSLQFSRLFQKGYGLRFILAMLGNGLQLQTQGIFLDPYPVNPDLRPLTGAIFMGALGIFIFISFLILALRNRLPTVPLIPFVVLVLFALRCATVLLLTHSNALHFALISHYITLRLPFWIGLVGLAALIFPTFWQRSVSPLVSWTTVGAGIALTLLVYISFGFAAQSSASVGTTSHDRVAQCVLTFEYREDYCSQSYMIMWTLHAGNEAILRERIGILRTERLNISASDALPNI